MLNCFKSRKQLLKEGILRELSSESPSADKLLEIFHKFEKNNLATIDKLKREKEVTMKKITGAIKQFLHAHPVLTRELISSLSKRIYGSLLEPKKESFIQRLFKWKK
jgi:hypothetical protein